MKTYLDGEEVKVIEYIIEDGENCAVVKYSDGDIDIAKTDNIEIY